MEKQQQMNLRKLATRYFLLLIGTLGVSLILLAEYHRSDLGWGAALIVEIGLACIVAAILGFAVDQQLKQGLVEDAVEASIGYLLPPQLKDEMRWVYDQKFLVSQTFNVRLEHMKGKNAVKFYGNAIRRVKNVSGAAAEMIFSGGIDEQFNPHGECELLKAGYVKDGKTYPATMKKTEYGTSYGSPTTTVVVAPGETIEWFFSYTLMMPETGTELITHRYPISEATVTVDVPESLVAFVAFSHRNKFTEQQPDSSGFISRHLDGILLPHQDIRVYWYRAEDIKKRKESLGVR